MSSSKIQRFTRSNAQFLETAPTYQKRIPTHAQRIQGPFEVETREGVLTCPDGYALDAHGWPYPIAKEEFEKIYERQEKKTT